MPEPASAPKVDGLRMEGKMTGRPEDIASALRTISFLRVAKEKSSVSAAYVESRDINKNPYSFSVVKFDKDHVEVVYTIPPSVSPTRRRMDMLRYLLNLFTLVGEYYEVDPKLLLQLLEQTVKEIDDFATNDYKQLYSTYDTLKREVDTLRRNYALLKKQVGTLNRENYDMKNENDELKLSMEKLQGMSDSALKTKLQEWVVDHSGDMNVSEFARFHRVPEARVEQLLDELVKGGFLELVQ
jgi:regulator of replication initiation timing